MSFVTPDEIRDARAALRAEGTRDTMDAVLEKLKRGSKSTLAKYWSATTPETATVATAVAAQDSNHTGGSMPTAQDTRASDTAPAPVETTPLPKLYEARARYHAAREPYGRVAWRIEPLRTKINAFKARQAQLTGERAAVATVERLREVKAELLSIEEELEILERDFAPLGKTAEALQKEVARVRFHCNPVREQALKHLETARLHHFNVKHNSYGANPRVLKNALEVLTEFVGEEDVEKYVTALTWPNETDRHVPPWASVTWWDASSTTQG